MAEEKSNKWYTDWKEYKIVTCASCGFLYKNGEKYCHDCGDDMMDIHLEVYVKPIMSVEFIELKFAISKENGECILVSKE